MWIRSIELKNFKSYSQVRFDFPEPHSDKNLILIGAENGHGKTTLLEAIYLCLYDADMMSHLKRAGLEQDIHYPDYLSRALHQDAEPVSYGYGNQYTMELSIEFAKRNHTGEREGVRVKRKYYFNEHRELQSNNSETSYFKIDDSMLAEPIDDEEGKDLLQTHALPMEYAPFFFFDGEKIVQTAERAGAGEWLVGALRGLSGVTLLENLQISLQDYQNQYIKATSTKVAQDKIDRLEKEVGTIRIKKEIAENAHTTDCEKENQLTMQLEDLLNKLGGDNTSNIKSAEEKLNEKQKLDEQIADFENTIKESVSRLPLAFIPRTKLQELMTLLEKERTRLTHEAGKQQIEGKVDLFWQQFVSNAKVKEVLGRSAEVILNDQMMREAVEECWNLLYYPLPEGCASKIRHNYLSLKTHESTEYEYKKLYKMNNISIGKLIEDIEKRKNDRDKLERDIKESKATGRDDLVVQLQQIQTQLKSASEQKGISKNILINAIRDLEAKQNELDKLMNEVSENNPRLKKSARAKQVQNMIERLTQRLIASKTEQIAHIATRIHGQLAHDDRIHRIAISEQGKMTLFGANNQVANVSYSAGQVQILIMALVLALAEATDYNTPFVIDTPLARLDQKHREGLFNHWSGLNQQIILLSQDTEITPEVHERLKPYILKTYHIQAKSLASGGAQSLVTADSYF